MGKNKLETTYKWRQINIKRYPFEFNLTANKEEYEHFIKQPNKREYLLNLIRKDMKKAR